MKNIVALFGLLLLFQNAQAQIINIEERRKLAFDSVQWHEQLQLGINLVQNKQSVLSIQGGAQLEFVFGNKMLMSITSANFIKAGDQRFVNEGFQHLRYNSKMNEWLIFELFGQGQYNEQAFIKIRALVGTGGRAIVINKDKSRLFAGLSYMYEYEEESENDVLHQDNRMNSYLSFQFEPAPIVQFSGTMYFQPLFKNLADYRLTFNSALTFKVSEKLSLSTTYQYMFDSRRPQGAPRRIYRLSNLVRYSF